MFPFAPLVEMRQWRSKSNQLKGPRATCWTWVLAFVKPIKTLSWCTQSLLRAVVIMGRIAGLALLSRFLQLSGILEELASSSSSKKIVCYWLASKEIVGKTVCIQVFRICCFCSFKCICHLSPNIMCCELAFYVAVQYGILHHKLKDREGMSPDRITSHEPAWLI